MKLAYNGLAPVFLFLLRWIDSSCTCLLPGYMNFFHVLIYKVSSLIFLLTLSLFCLNSRNSIYVRACASRVIMCVPMCKSKASCQKGIM